MKRICNCVTNLIIDRKNSFSKAVQEQLFFIPSFQWDSCQFSLQCFLDHCLSFLFCQLSFLLLFIVCDYLISIFKRFEVSFSPFFHILLLFPRHGDNISHRYVILVLYCQKTNCVPYYHDTTLYLLLNDQFQTYCYETFFTVLP